MEAPEKIYLPSILVANTVRYKEEGFIEYVRTDVFIKKACEFLNSSSILKDSGIVEKFKIYMKGE